MYLGIRRCTGITGAASTYSRRAIAPFVSNASGTLQRNCKRDANHVRRHVMPSEVSVRQVHALLFVCARQPCTTRAGFPVRES